MAERQTQELRRKHCGVDLQQIVQEVVIYKRPLNSSGGKSGAVLGLVHEAAVATSENGDLYLIEKGVDRNEDINYPVIYREGECRIVQLTERENRDWMVVRVVKQVQSGITLEYLFDACGSGYNLALDNCWNGTHRMCAKANPEEGGLTWQQKTAALGVGAAAVGFGLLAAMSSGNSDKKKVVCQLVQVCCSIGRQNSGGGDCQESRMYKEWIRQAQQNNDD